MQHLVHTIIKSANNVYRLSNLIIHTQNTLWSFSHCDYFSMNIYVVKINTLLVQNILSSMQHVSQEQLLERGSIYVSYHIGKSISFTDIRYSNELQGLILKMGHRESSPDNGCQCDMHYLSCYNVQLTTEWNDQCHSIHPLGHYLYIYYILAHRLRMPQIWQHIACIITRLSIHHAMKFI